MWVLFLVANAKLNPHRGLTNPFGMASHCKILSAEVDLTSGNDDQWVYEWRCKIEVEVSAPAEPGVHAQSEWRGPSCIAPTPTYHSCNGAPLSGQSPS